MAMVVTFGVLTFIDEEEAAPPAGPGTPSAIVENTPSPEPTGVVRRFAVLEGENRAGGYSFAYPPGWELSTEGSVSTLESSDGDVVVAFGLASMGDLDAATEGFAELLRDAYDVIEIGAPRPTEINGNAARSIEGTARNDDGVRLTFQAYTVRANGQNYALSVFARGRGDRPVLREIVGSFAVPQAG